MTPERDHATEPAGTPDPSAESDAEAHENEASRKHDAAQQAASWTRYSTIGLQFTVGIALFAYAGYWLDQKFEWEPWGVISGLLVGFPLSLTWLYLKVYPSSRDRAAPGVSRDDRSRDPR